MKKLALALILALIAGGSLTEAQAGYINNHMVTVHGHGGPPAPDGSPILYDVSLEIGGYVVKADEALKGANADEMLLRGNVRLTLAR